MRKAIVLFLILLVSFPTVTNAQSGKYALLGLKKLQARTQAGISYMDYSNALADAKFPLNLFIESNDAKKEKYIDLAISLLKAMQHYEFAGYLFDMKVKRKSPYSLNTFIYTDDQISALIGKNYPDAKKISVGYVIEDLIPFVWMEASKELDNATKLYAKLKENQLEEKKSDEIETLKKEMAELKEEVARLKKENELLKKRKK